MEKLRRIPETKLYKNCLITARQIKIIWQIISFNNQYLCKLCEVFSRADAPWRTCCFYFSSWEFWLFCSLESKPTLVTFWIASWQVRSSLLSRAEVSLNCRTLVSISPLKSISLSINTRTNQEGESAKRLRMRLKSLDCVISSTNIWFQIGKWQKSFKVNIKKYLTNWMYIFWKFWQIM